jgi:glycosyltransferase involved in cell wall biosynthesis
LWPQHQIETLVQSFQPDIVHLHEPLALGICGLKAAKTIHTPVVLTLHQLPWFVTKYTKSLDLEELFWAYGRHALKRYAAHIVPMARIAAVVKQHTGLNSQVIPYGLDLQRFQAIRETQGEAQQLRHKFGLSAHKPIMLHVGRLDVDKNVNYVIEAAARVLQKVDAELLVVGDGRQRQTLLKQCEALQIADRCHFTGFVSSEGDLPAIYRLADLFVTASEIETLGIVLLEAMASACPVVAVKATCIPDLVEDNHSGLLACPKDVSGLADRMIWLLQNPEVAWQMGRKGSY